MWCICSADSEEGGSSTGARTPTAPISPCKTSFVTQARNRVSRTNSGQTSAVNANVQLRAKISSCFSVVPPPPPKGPRRG